MATRRLVEVDTTDRGDGKVPSWDVATGTHVYINPSTASSYTVPTFVGFGAITSGTGDVTPPLATGHTTDDINYLLVQSSNEAVSTPAGWEKVGPHVGFGSAASAGSLRGTLFYKRDGGSESNPTVTDPGDHAVAVCFAIRGAITSGQPHLNVGTRRKTTASTTATGRAGATPVDACLVLTAFIDSLDSASARYSSPVNADLTNVTEQIDGGAVDGTGGGFGVITGQKDNAGTFAATTATVTSTVGASLTIVILPEGVSSRAGFIDIQEFTTTVNGTDGSDTWIKPTGAKRVHISAIGGGASGSAGRNAATAAGGGGGGGGDQTEGIFAAGGLPATLTLNIGTGGAATANTDGAASNAGGHSQVTSSGAIIVGGNAGSAAGASSSGSGGTGGNGGGRGSALSAGTTSYTEQPAGGGTGGTTAQAGGGSIGHGGGAGAGGGTTQGASAGGSAMYGGGGGGGGRSNTNVGTGGGSVHFGQLAGGASAGASGNDSSYYEFGGSGGAGGTSAAGPGGAGGWPGGGGGGGGSQSGAQRGGAGGDGVIVITTLC